MTTKTQKVHIDEIRSGDTVVHEGKVMTVGKKDISKGGFMGTTLFGDSYMCGYRLVTKVSY
jgi:hypothetical protein